MKIRTANTDCPSVMSRHKNLGRLLSVGHVLTGHFEIIESICVLMNNRAFWQVDAEPFTYSSIVDSNLACRFLSEFPTVSDRRPTKDLGSHFRLVVDPSRGKTSFSANLLVISDFYFLTSESRSPGRTSVLWIVPFAFANSVTIGAVFHSIWTVVKVGSN